MVVVSCGTPPETADTVTTPDASTASSTTSNSSPTTIEVTSTSSSTTTTEDPGTNSSSGEVGLPEELGLEPGVQIAAPADFPSTDELATLVNPFRGQPHPRARISSRFVVMGDRDELAAQGIDISALEGMDLIITYYDGFTIWDYPDGFREVQIPEGKLLYQAEDGSWQESDRFEWPPLPFAPEWAIAQWMAEGMLQAEPEVIGYELVADTATVHLHAAGGAAQLWLDETGAVIRLVTEVAEPENGLGWFTVWNVETLAPEPSGPLPSQP